MTPDELRRMDNDECIIFEKGIKPVKSRKFYYFKHPMARKMAAFEISHNDIGVIDRGEWRKYNPYNPYVEDKEDKEIQDLKVESLDDLFDDETKEVEKDKEKVSNVPESNTVNLDEFNTSQIESAPILPQEEEDEMYDLQKELEAKFDELFGAIDE